MTEPDPPATPRRAALVFVVVTVVLDMLALGMIVPVLPKLVESFMGGDTARAAEVYGLFGTVWALMQFLFSPVLGTLSDRWGRRPVILLSNLGLGLDYVPVATVEQVPPALAQQVVVAIAAEELVVEAAAVQAVVAAEAAQHVVTAVADQEVVAGRPLEYIVAAVARDRGRTGATGLPVRGRGEEREQQRRDGERHAALYNAPVAPDNPRADPSGESVS